MGILWHSTGAANPKLKRYVQPSTIKPEEDSYDYDKWIQILGKNNNANDWNRQGIDKEVNAWIGKTADGTVTSVQTLPWNVRPWGCGSGKNGSCNDGYIQFEICEDALADATYFNEIYKEGCELTAYLCLINNIDPKGTVYFNGFNIPTILCHQDAARLGFASNHADILHWLKYYGKTMEDIRNDVAELLKNYTDPEPQTANPYELVTEVNKYINAIDAKAQQNSKGILSPGVYYIYSAYPDGYQGMYNLTTDPTGKRPGGWINPIENVIKEEIEVEPEIEIEPEIEPEPEDNREDLVNLIMNIVKKIVELVIKLFKKEK